MLKIQLNPPDLLPDHLIFRILEIGIAPVAFLLMLAVGLSLELPAVAASLKPIRRLVSDVALAVFLPPVAALITVLALRPSGETAAAILCTYSSRGIPVSRQ